MADLAVLNGYDIRDRKLADAAVDTSVGTNDYVMVETSNGSYIKIGKENFTKSVREILGTIIYSEGGDKGTSVSQVPVLDASNDLGRTSVANLASVLGVYKRAYSYELTSGGELNNCYAIFHMRGTRGSVICNTTCRGIYEASFDVILWTSTKIVRSNIRTISSTPEIYYKRDSSSQPFLAIHLKLEWSKALISLCDVITSEISTSLDSSFNILNSE